MCNLFMPIRIEGLPGVQVGIKVDDGDGSVNLVKGTQDRENNSVVASEAAVVAS